MILIFPDSFSSSSEKWNIILVFWKIPDDLNVLSLQANIGIMTSDRKRELSINEQLGNYSECYNDGDLIVISNFRELPESPVPLKDMVACLLVIDGSMRLEVNGEELEATANDLVVCAPTTVISKFMLSPRFMGGVVLVSIKLMKELVIGSSNLLDTAFYLSEHPVLHLDEVTVRQLSNYIRLIDERIKHPLKKFNQEVLYSVLRAILYEFLGYLCRFIEEKPKPFRQGERLVRSFLEMLVTDKVKARSVSSYADRLFVTPKYLSVMCKSVVGRTASTLINDAVMREIKRQLKYSDKSIKEIALAMDFPNLSFFGKYVKAHLGMPPTEYRREVRECVDFDKS